MSMLSNTNYKSYQHMNHKNNYVIQNVKKLEIKTPNNTSLIGYSNLTINSINTERTNKAISTERRGSLKICNHNDFYILGKNQATKRDKNIAKNKNYKLRLNANKTSDNSNNSILKRNLETKGNKNRKPMTKYNTSNNFYKIPNQKALLRNKFNKKRNLIRNIYNDMSSIKNLEKDIGNNNDNDFKLNNKANNDTSDLKKKKNNTYINNNISMFNLHFNNNTNKSNNDSTFSSNMKNPSIENKKKTIRIEDENDTEEENEVDKTNNLFNLINMINYATKKKNKPEKKNDFEFEFINNQSIKNYNRSYYDQKNYKSIKDYIKDIQLRNSIKANKNKVKTNNIIKKNFYAERRRLNSHSHNNRYHSTGKRKLYIPDYNKSKDSLNLIKTKTNRDTFNVIKNFNTNTNPRYNTLTYYVPEKFELSINPRSSKSNTKMNTSKKKSNHNMLTHNITENYSSFHSSINSDISDIIQRRFLSNKKNKKPNKEEIEYLESDEEQNENENENEIANYNKSGNISANKSNDEKDEDKDDIDYLFNNISSIKKFEDNMAETIKNKLKSKLISVTDDLKNENDEEKLKYYIGPIDLSLISLKGNLKDSIEDLKHRFTEKGFVYQENDNENINGIKLIKDDAIYLVEVVKIRNNLLYYLFTKENKS